MALNAQTIKDLMTERKRLLEERKSLDGRIAAITKLLDVPRPENGMLQFGPLESPVGPFAGKGLRDALRELISNHPRGIRVGTAVKELTNKGYVSGGATPLRAQVSNELWRMEKKGELEKPERGLYKLKSSPQPGNDD